MTRHYVYYRVPAERVADAVAALRPLLGTAELLRRPEVKDGRVTLMEVHAGALAPEHDARLRAALAGLIDGERHVEAFEPLA